MGNFLRSLTFNILSLGKAYPTTLTEKRAIQELMRKLSPMSVGMELIRIGPKADGGYLVSDDLAGIEACFSPGVSLISGFEKECAELGMNIFLADRSVERPAESHDLFNFSKKYIGVTTDDSFMTMNDWVASSVQENNSDLLLQIDIEGYEYETFLSISDELMQRFRIIVAEFHYLNQLWNEPFFRIASRAFDKILQTHTCVHIHPNNDKPAFDRWGLAIPPMAEFTFLRSDRIKTRSPATLFPHPLDFDNTDNPHYPLPACWYAAR